jgi:cytochrome c oxidase assembly factor CtaG/ferredoxin
VSAAAAAALRSWTFQPWVVLPLMVTALVYARGWRQLRQQMPQRFGPGRLVAFETGLATVLLAIVSPLDAFSGLLLEVHMAQHLLLMMFAPPLIWLGAPVTPLLRGLPPSVLKIGVGPFLASPALQRFERRLSHPAVCWVVFVGTMWAWHAPALYELALRSPFWHQVEHLCFFSTGLLFWWPVIQPWPSRPVWPRWAIVPYLLLAHIQNTAFSAVFTFAGHVLYPTYAAAPRLWGISALEDQATAGAIMWVPGSLVLLVLVAWVILDLLDSPAVHVSGASAFWLPADPAAAAAGAFALFGESAGTRALPSTRHGRWDLLTVPLIGAVVRWRHFRRMVQTVMLLLAVAVIVDGLWGPQMSPMNLAGVLPWTYWRGLVVIALLCGGNFFCMACPFMLPRALGRWLLPARRPWPRALRTKWLAIALLGLYLWAYEAFALWDSPWWTAWIAVGYFGTALAVDGLFRGASFCKYVCPIGQFHFIQSLVSPLEVTVRDADVCRRCTTHDCIRGNAGRRGCELDLFQPEKVGNLDCTFCLDCIHACPHDNVGILAVPPGRDVIHDPHRASLRQLSQRPDVALLALVLIFGAFANAAGMVEPALRWEQAMMSRHGWASVRPAVSAMLLVALVIAPLLVATVCGVIGRLWSGVPASWREVSCRFAFALVPLGFSMWAAHFLFHLLNGVMTAVPVVQRAFSNLGLQLLGEPAWTVASAGVGRDWLLPVEILLLDGGLLLSLYLDWRIATGYARRFSRALKLAGPWLTVAVALYGLGIWIVFQPMQMRGMMMH